MRLGRLFAVLMVILFLGSSFVTSAAAATCISTPPRLTVTMNSESRYLVIGEKEAELFSVRFETTSVTPVEMGHLAFTLHMRNNTRNLGPSLPSFSLWNGDTKLAESDSLTPTSTLGEWWSFELVLPSGAYTPRTSLSAPLELAVKGDVSENGTPGSEYWISIAKPTDVDAFIRNPPCQGAPRTVRADVVLNGVVSSMISVYNSRLEVSSFTLGDTNGRARVHFDILGGLTFTADSAGDTMAEGITLRFSGDALLPNKAFIVLLTEGGQENSKKTIVRLPSVSMRGICKPDAWNSCMVMFRPENFVVSRGDSRNLMVQVSSKSFATGGTLNITVDHESWLLWNDGVIPSITGTPLVVGEWNYN